ncbi:hypothetical protein IscW_ISCW011748 [Ixodes scapularis]|uniref:Uncharacterized protein n=1 Tax=Ixodes scapularis TaxID=6945 RepID=B7Q5N9_IXOSC|nr:hypothetical protein IscW_ISCW011748 [Ixodes scapularis]|eukprot:XP_002411797.1 hypothetical protein IscW_ISCW011748 [Ixodes scapularis]
MRCTCPAATLTFCAGFLKRKLFAEECYKGMQPTSYEPWKSTTCGNANRTVSAHPVTSSSLRKVRCVPCAGDRSLAGTRRKTQKILNSTDRSTPQSNSPPGFLRVFKFCFCLFCLCVTT